jgi:dihydroorotase (multifunctional complex type)
VSELKKKGRNDPLALLEARPSISEAEAVQRAVLLASPFGTKLHIHHTSSKEGVEVIRRSKAMGASLSAETCPHYLLIDGVKYLQQEGSLVKIYPPVRGVEHSDALWRGLREGVIDIIASDHSPHLSEEKFVDDIWDVIAGWPGVETSLPLMLNEANNGRLTLNEIALYMSEGPAKVWGFYPKKGALNLESDGDLTIVDLKKEHTIKSNGLHSKNRFTPFEGWKVKGMPVYTIIRGNVLIEKGEFCPDTQRAQLIVAEGSVRS